MSDNWQEGLTEEEIEKINLIYLTGGWLMFWKKKDLYHLELELTKAKSDFDTYQKTFMIQASFSDRQRERLMTLRKRMETLEFEINNLKFKEIVNG